jgi:hypothetical protein
VVESQAALRDSGIMTRICLSQALLNICHFIADIFRFLGSFLQSQSALSAENLFLRKQLSLYQERQVRPHRAIDATRLAMILTSKLFDWSIPPPPKNGMVTCFANSLAC